MLQRVLTLFVGTALALPAGAAAQVAWDSPFMVGPGLSGGLGIHLVDIEAPGGDGVGALFTWRGGPVPEGIGFRAGVAEGYADEVAAFGGVDFSGYLIRESEDFPLDFIWAAGVGLGAGEYVLASIPLGAVVGRTFENEGVRFTPWAGPRLDLDAHLGRDLPAGVDDEELDLSFSVDLGADIAFSENLAIRFGASLADNEALSIGLVFPGVQ